MSWWTEPGAFEKERLSKEQERMASEGKRPILACETRTREQDEHERARQQSMWSSIWHRRFSIWQGDDV